MREISMKQAVKMRSHRPGFSVSALVCALLATSATLAGQKGDEGIGIDPRFTEVAGDIGYAHNTADRISQIGCYSYATSSGPVGGCFARDVTGGTASCFTSDPRIIEAIRDLSSDSKVLFSWDAGGHCDYVSATTDSENAPKT
jgi:hypothetical protein